MIVVENDHAALGRYVGTVRTLGRDKAWRAVIPGRPDERFELFADGHWTLPPSRTQQVGAAGIVPARKSDVTGPSSALPLHGSTQNVHRSTECGSDGPQRADRVCRSSRTLRC